jgi:putative peptidoglycan lipid II flippase
VSTRYPGDEPGRTYQYPPEYPPGQEDGDEQDPADQWDRQPAFYPAEPEERRPSFHPAEPEERRPSFHPIEPERDDYGRPGPPPAHQRGYQQREYGQGDYGQRDYQQGDYEQGRRDPAYPADEIYGSPGNSYRDDQPEPPRRDDPRRGDGAGWDDAPREDPSRRPAGNYRSPTTWNGPTAPAWNGPTAPAEPPGRDPGGWYQPPESPSRPAAPEPAEPRAVAPPSDRSSREPAGPDQRQGQDQSQGRGQDQGRGRGRGERAWWDDAFRAPSSSRTAPPARPAQAPRRPERPRPPSAQGYGVPPGELTQPIQIFQPQPRFVANPYEAENTYLDVVVEETSLDLLRERPASTGTSLGRTTGSMAVGTLISRVTGFLRTFVFVIALGTTSLANAYNNANTIPNAVYDVMIGGVLTSVVVPLLIKAAKEHRDGGEAYNQRMFTLTVLALGTVTIVATVAAGLLVDLYATQVHGTEHQLMVVFAYFFVPQIFFYGLSSLIGAILNTKDSFAAPMWTPIINNVVVIVVGLLFVVTVGLHKTAGTVSSGGVLLLGIGTTLGIIVQTVALVPALRRVGFRWRPRFDFRRVELAEIGRMALWMFGYVISTQITFIVTTNVANTASQHVADAGVSAYNYSYALFLLPYAIIGVSVTTALLPRMSRNAAEGRLQQVSDDFSYSIRLSSVILVPAALLLAVLGPALCEFLFAHGSTSTPDARYIGEAFGAFSLGLMPFVIFQLLLRVFYALHDSRTPAIIGFLTTVATVIGNFVVLAILPFGQVVVGMAFVYGLTSVFSAAIAWRLLNRRIGSLDGRLVTRSLIRMHVATIPALIFAFVVTVTVGVVLHPGPVYGFITSIVGGGGALLLYVIMARALHLDELSQLMRMVGGRFGGRSRPSVGR